MLVCAGSRIVTIIEVPIPENGISERGKRGLIGSVNKYAVKVCTRWGVA